jgi:hypothetical protein
MITAIVKFPLPAGTNLEDARAMYEASAPNYENLPGLVRKYYLFSEDGTGGGAYLWESRAAAEKLYSGAWRDSIRERFGADPVVEYFESPVIVDNA